MPVLIVVTSSRRVWDNIVRFQKHYRRGELPVQGWSDAREELRKIRLEYEEQESYAFPTTKISAVWSKCGIGSRFHLRMKIMKVGFRV